jgi:hypothetical protein
VAEERIRSFAEFWPYYVGEHRNPICRALHYFGTSAALVAMAFAIATGRYWLVPCALLFGYGPAWVGHFFIEHNKPATLKYPLWSLLSDFKMLGYALRGKMADEVARLHGSRPG